jgi:hypothetical protein
MAPMTAASWSSIHGQFQAARPAIRRSARDLVHHRRRDHDEMLAAIATRA